jgi:hypothetical protein
MNDPSAHERRSEKTSGRRPSERSTGELPALVIEVPLEGSGRVQIRAESYEDKRRLRLWLRHASRLPTLAAALEGYLNYLDDREAA